MPPFEGGVYKYVYSCWNDACVFVSACLGACVCVCVGGINKGTIHIRGSIEGEQTTLWENT